MGSQSIGQLSSSKPIEGASSQALCLQFNGSRVILSKEGYFSSVLATVNNNNSENMGDGYDFDLIVIGGGSGGLAAAKEAVKYGKSVALCDFVKPSPAGTTWGLGGTCVNVGCIPKKLMHQAALLGQAMHDAPHFGWSNALENQTHDWSTMVEAIQEHIQSLNWGYKTTLQQKEVTYFNAFAKFIDEHHILLTNKNNEESTVSAKDFIIAVGGRPRYLDIEGVQHCISSDDLFSLPKSPGKTLVVGGSYVALECAGFLAGLGFQTVVMARSILLRGFDQQMANMVGAVLESHDVVIERGWMPISVEVMENDEDMFLVKARNRESNEVLEDIYNTVILAVGRDPCTKDLGLENAGVEINLSNDRILTDESERSISVPNIYAIGDVAEGRPELTPVAIEAGIRLARRLYAGATQLTDYMWIATTVFTPLEYGCVGFSEEDAIEKFGADDIEVYHLSAQPLEFKLPSR